MSRELAALADRDLGAPEAARRRLVRLRAAAVADDVDYAARLARERDRANEDPGVVVRVAEDGRRRPYLASLDGTDPDSEGARRPPSED